MIDVSGAVSSTTVHVCVAGTGSNSSGSPYQSTPSYSVCTWNVCSPPKRPV